MQYFKTEFRLQPSPNYDHLNKNLFAGSTEIVSFKIILCISMVERLKRNILWQLSEARPYIFPPYLDLFHFKQSHEELKYYIFLDTQILKSIEKIYSINNNKNFRFHIQFLLF